MTPSLPGMDIEGVDELFTLPPAAFTAARNALVKQLRAEKRRDDAEAVKALRRPSVPAWAVNQAARRNPDAIERLIEAGAAVAASQRRALSGVRDAGLREASAARRERIDEVWKLAAGVLRDAGVEPQPHRPAIAATLEAASVEPEAAEAVRRGRLTVDLPAPSGFGAVSGFSLVAADVRGQTDEDAAGEEAAPGDEAAPGAEAVPAVEQDAAADRKVRRRAEEELADALGQRNRLARRAQEFAERAAEQRRQAVRAAAEADRLEQRAAQARAAAERDAEQADDLAEDAAQAERTAAEAVAEFERRRAALEELD